MCRCFEEICSRIHRLSEEKETILIAIDGNCTAGKTTLAGRLAEVFPCNVFHMDEFFLQPYQRTAERLAAPGGNVDYERFAKEVLAPLKAGQQVTYRPYDCRSGSLKEAVTMPRRKINIIEGTYSCHPYFGSPYDLTLFLSVSPEVQRQRVLERPAFKHRMFFETWIPMEQKYFEAFGIADSCSIRCSGQEELWP
jgi:uridine kinase